MLVNRLGTFRLNRFPHGSVSSIKDISEYLKMNSTEIQEIKKTWEIPSKSPTDAGAAILIRFFEKYPDNLQKFAAFKDTPVPELNSNPRFRSHASNIIRTFDDSIKTLDDASPGPKLEEIWAKIGNSHYNRKIEKKSFNELKGIIIESLTELCSLNENQVKIWSKLLDYVYNIVFQNLDKLGGQ